MELVWICLALGAAVFLLYGRVVGHPFLNLDDDEYIGQNETVLAGLTWKGVRWAFTTASCGNWHPLTWLSHMLDAELYGNHPGGHHMTSVLIHALNAVILLLALRRLTQDLWSSAAVAAFFAVHPLRVESVAWAAERKDVLSGLFFLLTILAYAGYARRPTLGRYLLVFASMGLGLMTKPMGVTIPFVLLLLDVWPLGRLRLARGAKPSERLVGMVFLEKLPLMALSTASSVITLLVQRRGGAVSSLREVPFPARLGNAAVSYLSYLRKMCWPDDLAVLYPHPAMVSTGTSATAALAACLALVVVSVFALRAVRTRPYVLVGWLWYVGTLLPVIGLVQVGRQAMADRYTYVPMIGIYLALTWGARELVERHPRTRVLFAGAAVVVLAASMTATWRQVGYWRDGLTLYQHALEVTTGDSVVHTNLGATLADQGRYREAIAQYEAALRLDPDYADAHNNLGVALKGLGRLREAESHLQTSIRLWPDHLQAHHNLGTVLEAQGRFREAKAQYEAALKIRPDYAYALLGLGTVLAREGDLTGALERLERAVQLHPRSVEIRENLGAVLLMRGRLPDAAEQYEEALRMRPDDPAAHAGLAETLRQQGRTEEADAHRREADRLRSFPAGR